MSRLFQWLIGWHGTRFEQVERTDSENAENMLEKDNKELKKNASNCTCWKQKYNTESAIEYQDSNIE